MLNQELVEKVKWLGEEGRNFEEVVSKYVPYEGKAATILGEIARCIERLRYRWYNDGDLFFIGYGIESCGGDAHYLSQCDIDGIVDLFHLDQDVDEDERDEDYYYTTLEYLQCKNDYEKFLNQLVEEFMKALKDKELVEDLLQENNTDGREMDAVFDYMNFSEDSGVYSIKYIITNKDDDSTLMKDGTFKDWEFARKNGCETNHFHYENEAVEYKKSLENSDNLEVISVYYFEFENDYLSKKDNKSEAIEEFEDIIINEWYR